MKKILLGLIIMPVFMLPMSYGATQNTIGGNPASFVNPQVKICNQQLDAESTAFFQQQGAERGAFITANKDIIAKQDRRGKWLMSHRRDDPGTPPDLTSQESGTFSAFVQKQQSEKVVFLNKLNQDRQNCLNGETITTPSGL